MRKIICACLVLLTVCMAYTCANAQQKQKSTVVTYYPAPRADYKTIRLDPTNQPATASGAGQMYYNGTNDTIMYYNNVTWVPFGGGFASGPTDHLPPIDGLGGTCSTGDVYNENGTDIIQYYNKTGNWTVIAPDINWRESALIPASGTNLAHYNVYLINSTSRRVGIGTSAPTCALDVRVNDTPDSLYEDTRALYLGGYYTDKGTDQWFSFHLIPNGSQIMPGLDSSAMMYASNDPAENLKFAALDASGSISFNVGGYSSANSELMRLTNPGGASNPSPRVGIGNATLPFALFVDSEKTSTVFATRGIQPTSGGANPIYKSGYWNMIPYSNRLYLAFGLYERPNDLWYLDKFTGSSGTNGNGTKFSIFPATGISYYKISPGNYDASGYVDNWTYNNETMFNIAGNAVRCSSRKLKENFTPLNPDDLLQKIDQLEVTRWNFIGEGPSVKRIGPVAEDFYKLFELGKSGEYIYPMDSAGVSFAAVKALSGKLNAQQRQIEGLEAAIKDIKSQLSPRR